MNGFRTAPDGAAADVIPVSTEPVTRPVGNIGPQTVGETARGAGSLPLAKPPSEMGRAGWPPAKNSGKKMDSAIDVYTFRMDEHVDEVPRFLGTLSRDEHDRAQRFRTERDRRRYIVRRGLLRDLLSPYLDRPPERIRFACSPDGKLSLKGGDLRFNLSHSHGLVVYAIARGREVGCDIEWRDCRFVAGLVPEKFFSPLEIRMLHALATEKRTEGFFNCWTRKEAYIKARGVGASFPLRGFDVSLAPDEPAALLNGCDGWSVQSFEPAPRYQAAIVAEGTGWRLNQRRGVGRLRAETLRPRAPEPRPIAILPPPPPAPAPAPVLSAVAMRPHHLSAAVCTGASHSFVSSASSAVTVSEQPAISREVQ
jgi:4'-phosphopantetheinyl transferase